MAAKQKEMKAKSHGKIVEMETNSQLQKATKAFTASQNSVPSAELVSAHDSEGTSLDPQLDGEAFDPDEF